MNVSNRPIGTLLLAKLSLMLVVCVDVMGQGLLFPILNTVITDPNSGLLPTDTSVATRRFDYGFTIGIFFLAWFLGAVYISKISDSIGRKKGIMLCLGGTLLGYILTLFALLFNSFLLLLIGRAITGFTAGSQPIAQAAMVDLSRNEADKARNLAYIIVGTALGVIAGPVFSGILSDQVLLGTFASSELPIYAATSLVLLVMLLIVLFYREMQTTRVPLRVQPQEVILQLWRVTKYPTVMRISIVFFFSQFVSTTVWVFLANYMSNRFKFSTPGTSASLIVFGIAMVIGSFYVTPLVNKHFTKQTIITRAILIEIGSIIALISAPTPLVAFCATSLFALAFAVRYPTFLVVYSSAADQSEQGWIMGVGIALFTLGGGIASIFGGQVLAIGIRYPFYAAILSALLALILIRLYWNTSSAVRKIVQI